MAVKRFILWILTIILNFVWTGVSETDVSAEMRNKGYRLRLNVYNIYLYTCIYTYNVYAKKSIFSKMQRSKKVGFA
jgi:hypothetical protein